MKFRLHARRELSSLINPGGRSHGVIYSPSGGRGARGCSRDDDDDSPRSRDTLIDHPGRANQILRTIVLRLGPVVLEVVHGHRKWNARRYRTILSCAKSYKVEHRLHRSRAHSNLLLNLTLRYPFPETCFASNPLYALFHSFSRPAHQHCYLFLLLLLLLLSTHQRNRVPTTLNPVSAPLMTNVCLISVGSLASAWSIARYIYIYKVSGATRMPFFVYVRLKRRSF